MVSTTTRQQSSAPQQFSNPRCKHAIPNRNGHFNCMMCLLLLVFCCKAAPECMQLRSRQVAVQAEGQWAPVLCCISWRMQDARLPSRPSDDSPAVVTATAAQPAAAGPLSAAQPAALLLALPPYLLLHPAPVGSKRARELP